MVFNTLSKRFLGLTILFLVVAEVLIFTARLGADAPGRRHQLLRRDVGAGAGGHLP
jgi:hypothetical protein